MSKRELKGLDLFCGIGGLTNGLHQAGICSVGAIDIWDEALNTFRHNFPDVPTLVADLTKTPAKDAAESLGISLSEIDLLVGGPPCQGFSTVGKRDESDPRNKLWEAYFSYVETVRPAYVLIENVEGMASIRKGEICDGICKRFGEIGYVMKWKLLRSADYGVPQLRKRVIFLGWLEGLTPANHPKPTVEKHVTVDEAIGDLPELSPSQIATEYTAKPINAFQKARRGRCRKLANHEAANHSAHLVEVLSHIPDGGNRKSIPDHLQPKSGFHNSYARLASDKPAVAVTSNMRKPSSARATHPFQNRGLTAREGLRLQTFDDCFLVLGSRSSQYLQVGNAVPPLLAKALGLEIARAFEANSQEEIREARKKKIKPVDFVDDSYPLFHMSACSK